jgi:hypothetical protein
MLQIVEFLVGFIVVLGCLFLVGITRGRWVSQRTWVILWSIVSLVLALFLVVSFVLEDAVFLSYTLGGSLGCVIAVTIHAIQHF